MSFDADLIGDFILMKSDGYPTYQFASPIDDALMKISHVIRGEDTFPTRPPNLMVVDALGYDRPLLTPTCRSSSPRTEPAFEAQAS